MKKYFIYFIIPLLFACGSSSDDQGDKPEKQGADTASFQTEVQTFLDDYTEKYQQLYYASALAEWDLNTYIKEGDTIAKTEAEKANQAFADYTGSKEVIESVHDYLYKKEMLLPIQVKQLETILYQAGANPGTAPDIVKERIAADAAQTEALFGFEYKLNGKAVTTNDLDRVLKTSSKLDERLAAWRASKEVGKNLKKGLENLRFLRNKSVQELGYSDYYTYQVSDYGMSTEEMTELCNQMVKDVWPLYRELHTWARYTLAKRYGKGVPEMLPAHWLPNRWGQDWAALVDVEGINLDDVMKDKGAEWIVKEGEKFYMSLGFDALPTSFYERSSLYPLPPDADYKKNNHASAWHLNLDDDVRSLMSIEPNTEWWETTLHELGHIYYYITYTNEDVPVILRGGANRAYHEAMGSLLGLASLQKPFLQHLDLIPKDVETDETKTLLKEALNYIVLIPWGAGVMPEFERNLYAEEISIDEFNSKWWEIKKKYQGIVPPEVRGEEYCDAASKTHINNDPAQYYDYALSYVLLFQFHDHIAKNILKQDPHTTNYYGSKETGKFLHKLMYPGATVDWREHLKENLGSGMSAKPMMEYFAPLMEYLKKENEGRVHTLPETI